MRKDLDSLKRRPFLFPLLMPLAMMAVVVVVAIWVFDARATTVVIALRPAEVDAVAESDPNLNLAGKERAARLAHILSQLQTPRAVDAVFASESRRAQQTGQPLAEALALPINVVPASGWADLVDRINREHRGEVVVVIGESKTLSSTLESLTGQTVVVPEGEFGRLYVVFAPRLSRTRILQLLY